MFWKNPYWKGDLWEWLTFYDGWFPIVAVILCGAFILSVVASQQQMSDPNVRRSCVERGGTIVEHHGLFTQGWECHGLKK